MNEIREKLSNWRDSPYSWIGTGNIVKMPILPNLICRISTIPITLGNLFCGYQQALSKVYMENQKTQNCQHGVEEEES